MPIHRQNSGRGPRGNTPLFDGSNAINAAGPRGRAPEILHRRHGKVVPPRQAPTRAVERENAMRLSDVVSLLRSTGSALACPSCAATEHAARAKCRPALPITSTRCRCASCGAHGRAFDFAAHDCFGTAYGQLDHAGRVAVLDLQRGAREAQATGQLTRVERSNVQSRRARLERLAAPGAVVSRRAADATKTIEKRRRRG